MTVKRTRLCYWIARPAKPGVQSSNTSRVRFTVISHTPMRSRFYHTHIMYKWNWDYFFLVKLIYFALHIFQIRNLLHCVDESWWNMPFKGTRLSDGQCCCYAVTIVTACSSIMTSRSLNTYYDVTQCMNGLWIFITKLESPKGDSQTWSSPPRNNGACVITSWVYQAILVEMTDKTLYGLRAM